MITKNIEHSAFDVNEYNLHIIYQEELDREEDLKKLGVLQRENPVEAMIRETREETGLVIVPVTLLKP